MDGRQHEKLNMISKTDKRQKNSTNSAAIPQIKPTGQRRSLERGKSTRKKNPGKRANQGG